MAYNGYDELASLRSEGREPGTRRKKLAGYFKAANELRQSYFAQDGSDYSARDASNDSGVEGPGAFPDAAVVRSGNEEMILFPSYARKHIKGKPTAPLPAGEVDEQEFWRREWEKHQDDNAIVDVDVRGWIYTPHRGQTTRKQRLMIGLARQLSGLPAPARPGDPAYSSQASSRVSSTQRDKQDEDIIAHEAENIIRKGEKEERYARRGAFSETPGHDQDGDSVYDDSSRASSRNASPERGRNRLSQISLASSTDGDSGTITPLQTRSSWAQPGKMSSAELAVANNHLLNRLKPFMANPLANTPISAFFYNDSSSRQHTVYTNSSGHFSCRAALDFVPTHVRVLAGENLYAIEEVTITSPKGVSLISDIDDTIKHSGITSGAREIFRNAFVREHGNLTIDGVREWYNTLHDMGVPLHYVSNSPWQMYPALTTFFKLAHLPKGSFHLKQYSGMLQGIFEPVAERKKVNLEKIMGDFPDRKFILVGDSGEADLEVYTDVALDHPGRVLGIFIRDVTTPIKTSYFDGWNGGTGGGRHHSREHSRHKSGDTLAQSKRLSRPDDIRNDDADLRAAVAASLADMEEETRRARKTINPDSPSPENVETPKARPSLPLRSSTSRSITATPVVASPEEDLIDLSDEPVPNQSWLTPSPRNDLASQVNGGTLSKQSPSPPPKPRALRSPSPKPEKPPITSNASSRAPPPRPRKPSSAVKQPSQQQVHAWTASQQQPNQLPAPSSQFQPSPLSQMTPLSPGVKERPPLPTRGRKDTALTKGLANTHKAFAPATHWQSGAAMGQPRARPHLGHADTARTLTTTSTKSMDELRPSSSSTTKAAPPPPPPRLRNMASYSTTVRKATNRLSGGWDDGNGDGLPGTPGEAGVGKKEFLWNQRWARAKTILDKNGVTLRSWRVGSDVADVCVRLAEHALRDIEREQERRMRRGGVSTTEGEEP